MWWMVLCFSFLGPSNNQGCLMHSWHAGCYFLGTHCSQLLGKPLLWTRRVSSACDICIRFNEVSAPNSARGKWRWSIVVLNDRMVVSVMWLVHIIIFMLCDPPEDPFLNQIFIQLDKAWGAHHKLFLGQFHSFSHLQASDTFWRLRLILQRMSHRASWFS